MPATEVPPPTVTPTATPNPPAEALLPDIVRWNVRKSFGTQTIYAELHNPNPTLGLLRATYSLAAIAADGSVVAVLGQGGVPGSIVSTIYQLPPDGTYVVYGDLPNRAPAVDHLEITVPSVQWMDWAEVDPPPVAVMDPRVRSSAGYPSVTGRVEVQGDTTGPFNVYVMNILEDTAGFFLADATANCIDPDVAVAFEAPGFVRARRPALTTSVAYTTTVPGVPGSVDDADYPLGCP